MWMRQRILNVEDCAIAAKTSSGGSNCGVAGDYGFQKNGISEMPFHPIAGERSSKHAWRSAKRVSNFGLQEEFRGHPQKFITALHPLIRRYKLQTQGALRYVRSVLRDVLSSAKTNNKTKSS